MRLVLKIIYSITIMVIIGFLSACRMGDANLEIINNYHEPVIKFGLGKTTGADYIHDVNIAQGESFIHTSVKSGSYRVFLITNDNRASNFVPFYAAYNATVTISLSINGTLTINQ